MSDPIHSSSWTGDAGEPTNAAGAISATSDFERRILRPEQQLDDSPELRQLRRTAALLVVSPLALWIAYWFAHSVIPDAFANDYSGPLALWTYLAIGVGVWQFQSGRGRALRARRAALAAGLGATLGGAVLYGYAASTSYARALPSARERTFEIYRCSGRCRFGGYFVHQRADGSTVEGEYAGRPLAYGTSCALVQRYDGEYGFSWVRVLDRSPPPEHEVIWPIRREDCFSAKPLASLRK